MLSSWKFDADEWNTQQVEKYSKVDELNRLCRERGIWVNTPYSGVCWIFEEVLHIDPVTVSLDSIELNTGYYETFINTGDRSMGRVGHYLNAQQMDALEPWMDYIPDEVRYGY